MPTNHKLAAILFADIADYTAMMQSNEQMALERLTRFQEVLEEITPKFGGQIVHYFGDGCLLTFDSSTSGVDCAIALQKAFNETLILPVRIGLHLGDVVFKNDNVFGDGVNIASRIESLGVPGAILISKSISDQIKNKSDYQFVSIGRFDFKNVSEPMEVLALANPGLVVPKRGEMHGKLKYIPIHKRINKWWPVFVLVISGSIFSWWFFSSRKIENGEKTTVIRSIAVLPFSDLSPNNNEDWFVTGMTDALLSELSKISALNVRSRTSVMQYQGTKKTIPEIARELNVDAVVEGAALWSGSKVRITAQLINAKDKHLWASDYDAEMEDVLRIHHDIAQAITRGIKVVLTPADSARFTKPNKVNPKAWEADSKGNSILFYFETLDDLQKAIHYFQEAIALDSAFAKAYAHLASAYSFYPYYGEKSPQDSWELAEGPNNKALQLDPQLALAYINQFKYLYFIRWDWDGALRALSMAETLDANNPELLFSLNNYYVATGRFGKAFEICERIRIANPSDSLSYPYTEAFTQFHSRDIEGSLRTIEKGLALFPDNIGLLELKSWSLSVAGSHEEAVRTCRMILAMLKGPSLIDHELAGWIFANAGLRSEAMNEMKILKASKYCDPVALSLIYAGLGDKDEAMRYYQEAFLEHSNWLPFIKRSPAFDVMRGDPRFEKLIRDLKFP